jgi:alpha-2-macroglobulin
MVVLKSVTPVQTEFLRDGAYPLGEMFRVTLTVETAQDRYFVVMDDPLPAGLETINVSLATVSEAVRVNDRQENDWWSGFNHVEKHDDRVMLFADYLPAGVTTFTYLARATTSGTFQVPPTKAEEMYTPEVFGRTVSKVVRVK